MPDLIPKLLPDLDQNRLPGLDLGQNTLYPAYYGQSILNIPSTIARLFDIPMLASPPLRGEIVDQLTGPYQRVIFLLVDALALGRLRSWLHEPEFGAFNDLVSRGVLAPITSIVPSTTCAALTTLWTGVSAAEHGILGYELWLKEYGLVANMITHSPFSFERQFGLLQDAGFVPETFLSLRTLGSHLRGNGVNALALQHHSILGSGLSSMYFTDVKRVGFHSPVDLWITLRQLIEAAPNEKSFYGIYWPDVDTMGHKFGPDDERVRAGFVSFVRNLAELFLDRLDMRLRKNTLFILAADHGMIHTENDPHYDLRNHPNLTRRLHMQPTGENRLVYLFVKPGQSEAVREYIEKTWPNQFTVLDSSYVQSSGLFGPGTPHARMAERIGDLVVVAKGNAYWWWGEKDNPLVGRHGGLSPEDMLVPFLASPLA
ncbi:MAG: alkaline phosphatase family protein [Anaerolineales bacterium]